jgi:hypothetical protein
VSDFEDILRRSIADRAASLRTAPDESDVAARIRLAEQSSRRTQRAMLVTALVVVAGSTGGVLGAVASRPSGVGLEQTSSHVVTTLPFAGPAAVIGSHTEAHTPPSGSKAVAVAVHKSVAGGVTVDWIATPTATPVEVFAGSSLPVTCSKAEVISLAVGEGAPVASGSAVVGLPSLQPGGLAVLSSGTFTASGHAAGWWTVLEAGSAATTVAVQFPSGSVARTAVSAGGIAVLAGLAPPGSSVSSYSEYGSAVAEGATQAMGSMEFLFGAGISAVDAIDGAGAAGTVPLPGCGVSQALASDRSGAAGPPAPLTAAGDVVAAFAQAYDVNPLLGLTWNFSAVDLGSAGPGSAVGCPVDSFAVSSSNPDDGLAAPAVAVAAIAFTSATNAVVLYRRSGGGLLETGTASLVDGVWKVGGAGYCRDLASP